MAIIGIIVIGAVYVAGIYTVYIFVRAVVLIAQALVRISNTLDSIAADARRRPVPPG